MAVLNPGLPAAAHVGDSGRATVARREPSSGARRVLRPNEEIA